MNKTVGLFNSNLLQWSLEILQPNKCVAIEAYIASLFILSCNKYIPIAKLSSVLIHPWCELIS